MHLKVTSDVVNPVFCYEAVMVMLIVVIIQSPIEISKIKFCESE